MAAPEAWGGGGGGGEVVMCQGRAVVAAVLSAISLIVLSLHVALCLHYPSPLFAVTLLLNPSLWMLLGAVGMGCALALTYRERQRKVRAALCTTCHTRYGSTGEGKCREGVAPRPRGPSRAVYAYNGISHKFYASYGAISEKQGGGIKLPCTGAALQKVTAIRANQGASGCEEGTPLQAQETSSGSGSTDSPPVDGTQEASSPGEDNTNPDSPSASQTDSPTPPAASVSSAVGTLSNCSDEEKKSPQKVVSNEEKLACNCLSRYGGMGHRVRERGHRVNTDGAARRRQGQPEVRTVGKYHKRLLMQCRARDPKDVPVHLFTTSGVSATSDVGSTVTEASSDTTSVDISSDSQPQFARESAIANAVNQQRDNEDSPGKKETHKHTGCGSPTNTTPTSDTRKAHASLPSASTCAPSHTPVSPPPSLTPPTHPSPSPPHSLASHPSPISENTYKSVQDTVQNLQDPDVVSVSSECGLLPSSESAALLRSPLWGSLGAARRERRAEGRQPRQDGNRRPPLSSFLATTRRVLARPRWTRQEERMPPAMQLSPSSSRKRRVPGVTTSGRLWRQRRPSPARAATSLVGESVDSGLGGRPATPVAGEASGSGISQTNSPDLVNSSMSGPSIPVRPRERKVRRTRPRPRPRDAAGDSVLLLSDDATE